jgi:hypothetical protein
MSLHGRNIRVQARCEGNGYLTHSSLSLPPIAKLAPTLPPGIHPPSLRVLQASFLSPLYPRSIPRSRCPSLNSYHIETSQKAKTSACTGPAASLRPAGLRPLSSICRACCDQQGHTPIMPVMEGDGSESRLGVTVSLGGPGKFHLLGGTSRPR